MVDFIILCKNFEASQFLRVIILIVVFLINFKCYYYIFKSFIRVRNKLALAWHVLDVDNTNNLVRRDTCPDSNKINNSLKVNLRILAQFSFSQSLWWEVFHEISGINSPNHDMIRSKSNNSQNLNSNLNLIFKDGNK